MFSDFVAVPFEEDWSKFINKLNKKSKSNSELKKIIIYSSIKINVLKSDVGDKLSEIKTHSSSVHFKDTMDYQIFCEMVVNLSTNFMIDFYTDDKEFSKKSGKAYSLLEQKLGYNHSWLNIIYCRENN